MDPNDPTGGNRPGWVPPPGAAPPQPQGWAAPGAGWQPQPGAWGAPMPAPAWAQPPKRKRFGWGAVIAAFVVGGILSAIVTFVGLIVLALAIGMPDAIAGTHQGVEEGTPAVKVGDCLTGRPSTAVVVDRSQVVDCNQGHNSEVAAVIEIPGGTEKPGDDDLQAFVDDACALAFQGYVDSDPDMSQYGYAAVVPSAAAWADGDRTGFCLVDTIHTGPGMGTVRGSGD